MKCLVYEWSNYMFWDLKEVLTDHKIESDTFQWKFSDNNHDEVFEQWFAENIPHNQYEFVISINYWPPLAEMCHRYGYKYIAWCCDCPFNSSNPETTMVYPGNYIFVFDRNQYNAYKNQGIDTVYHLPLGVNGRRAKAFNYQPQLADKYQSDVSFVGRLYESDLGLIESPLDEPTRAVLDELINVQTNIYGQNILDQCITTGLIDTINAQYESKNIDQNFRVNKKSLQWALASEVTRRDRIILLNLCGKRWKTDFYSDSKFQLLEGINQRGECNYITEMPYIFRYSKINLNPSLRLIETGIPLRAFDIMGNGGLLLSNYQEELAEMYVNKQECLIYNSYEEAIDLITYYMDHEEERAEIAKQGMVKTLSENTLQLRFDEIMRIAKL